MVGKTDRKPNLSQCMTACEAVDAADITDTLEHTSHHAGTLHLAKLPFFFFTSTVLGRRGGGVERESAG